MNILFKYLKPYKWLMALTLVLAGVNIGFSLVDPIIFGKLVNLANYHQSVITPPGSFVWNDFLFANTTIVNKAGRTEVIYGLMWLIVASISVAMISRIAKAFQDYFLNLITQKFGASVFTDGLKHAMGLPY